MKYEIVTSENWLIIILVFNMLQDKSLVLYLSMASLFVDLYKKTPTDGWHRHRPAEKMERITLPKSRFAMVTCTTIAFQRLLHPNRTFQCT